MRVDQAGHDPLPAGIDHLHGPAILELHVGRQGADALDPVALDDDGIVARGRLAGAVDQGAVADHQGLLARGGGHDDPPIQVWRTRRYLQTRADVNKRLTAPGSAPNGRPVAAGLGAGGRARIIGRLTFRARHAAKGPENGR